MEFEPLSVNNTANVAMLGVYISMVKNLIVLAFDVQFPRFKLFLIQLFYVNFFR